MAVPASLRGLACRTCTSWSRLCRAQLLHREALQARTRRLHHATAATAALGPEADELPPPVQPPPTVHYSAEAANAVALCGTVLADPQVHRLPASQVVAHVRLALSAPASRPELAQQPQGAVTVDAWGSLALQLEAYVRKGSRIQVHGALREDRWRDRATSEWRRAVKVVAEELAMVAPPEGGEPLPAAAEGLHHEEEQAAAEAQQALAAQLQPEAPPRASSSAEASRHMYEGEGRSFDEVAAARGIKPSTAVDHLLACAAAGTFASFTRLAAELQLGLPGSAWLSAAEVAEAVADVEQQQPGTPLSRLPLRAIRERLQAGTATGPKLAALEAQRGGDPVLVYGAIKLVLTALQHGVDFALISPPQPAAPPAPF